MVDPTYHLHLRRRIHEYLEPYPHPDRLKNFVDRLVFFGALFGLVMTLPQLAEIWINKTAEGVSLLSWASYVITATAWCLYGLLHNDKHIMFTYAVWTVVNILIVIGILTFS
jgi:uncharacterized protein with PQ loop repeat